MKVAALGCILLHSRADAGNESEYRDWYRNVHSSEVGMRSELNLTDAMDLPSVKFTFLKPA